MPSIKNQRSKLAVHLDTAHKVTCLWILRKKGPVTPLPPPFSPIIGYDVLNRGLYSTSMLSGLLVA